MLRPVLPACALAAAVLLLPAAAAASGPMHRPGVTPHHGGLEGQGQHRRHHRRAVFAPFPVQPWAPQRPQVIILREPAPPTTITIRREPMIVAGIRAAPVAQPVIYRLEQSGRGSGGWRREGADRPRAAFRHQHGQHRTVGPAARAPQADVTVPRIVVVWTR